MHRSVLQNEKYMEFAADSTVEVMAFQRLDEGIAKKDPKAGTYAATDAEGEPVQYLNEFPGLTVKDIESLNRSKAGTYNDTGSIPYTAFIDPHTLKRVRGIGGGQSPKRVMELVAIVQEELSRKYGAPTLRSDLVKFEAEEATVRETLEKKGVAKAFSAFKKLEKVTKKAEGKLLGELQTKVMEDLMSAASDALDEAESLIDSGDVKAGKKILNPLKSPLKKSDLAAKWKELSDKAKAAAE